MVLKKVRRKILRGPEAIRRVIGPIEKGDLVTHWKEFAASSQGAGVNNHQHYPQV